MNVYDFDKTIYKNDSTMQFYLYCLKKQKSLIKYLIKQLWAFLLYLFKVIDKTTLKQKFYVFLKGVKNIDQNIKEFWDINKNNFNNWYLQQKKETDVVISASPRFLLEPAIKMLGLTNLICSEVDKFTGKYSGKNCYGEEKVNRFKAQFNCEIENFYSDSLSDKPLADMAKCAYIVSSETLTPWQQYKMPLTKKLKKMFFSPEFILFLFVGCVNAICGIVFALLYNKVIFEELIAFTVGYLTCLVFVSYPLNTFITFHEKISFIKFIKFCASYIPNYLVQILCVFLLNKQLGVNYFFTCIIAVVIGIPITFVLIKIFAFVKRVKK